ncbi:MAG: hypothetical protein P4L16_03650 [Chlamydiales bacterium]|nr:hypothetical protein [Chlamydiales bacterium]
MTEEFEEWLGEETARSRVQIAKRLSKIREEGYFADHKISKRVCLGTSEGQWEEDLLFSNSCESSIVTFGRK